MLNTLYLIIYVYHQTVVNFYLVFLLLIQLRYKYILTVERENEMLKNNELIIIYLFCVKEDNSVRDKTTPLVFEEHA